MEERVPCRRDVHPAPPRNAHPPRGEGLRLRRTLLQ